MDHIGDLVALSRENSKRALHHINDQVAEITYLETDGRSGVISHAPYDCIHVGATVGNEDDVLYLSTQLTKGGTMVLPVGKVGYEHQLRRVVKDLEGNITQEVIQSVVCTPLQSKEEQLKLLMNIPKETRTEKKARIALELEEWKQDFQTIFGRKPSRQDMFDDPVGSALFQEYARLTKL